MDQRKALPHLPPVLRAMAEEDGQAELCCHFCRNRFVFGKEELLEMIAQKTVDSAPN